MCLYLYTQAAWFLQVPVHQGEASTNGNITLFFSEALQAWTTETEGDWGLLGDLQK